MRSVWASIAYIFNIISLSPNEPGGALDQLPFLSDNDRPEMPIGRPRGPRFRPPSASSWADIECDYSAMAGYSLCSTDGDRSCWIQDSNHETNHPYNISTNYEKNWPIGITRKYYIELEEKVISPDGVERAAMLVNGSLPGPWIQACWGDDLEITVKNNLKSNGTTIHWHGIRQWNTTAMDGVNAVSQCPIAPGETFTYKFKALQYGTSWYHSHYSLQYGEGLLGPLTIHGPSSGDYDEAKSPVMMSDWSHVPMFARWAGYVDGYNNTRGVDNILVNGTGIWKGAAPNGRYTLSVKKGRRYLLRLINTSIETAFVFAIDNHKIQVVGADFVPIMPYMTDHVVVGIGQRYHIIVVANPIDGAHNGSYWIRTIPAEGCNPRGLDGTEEKTGIVRYGDDTSEPPNLRGSYDATCRDEPYDKLVPVLPWKVGKPSNFAADSQFDIGLDETQGEPFYPANIAKLRWNMYSDTMWLNFSNPTLTQLESPPNKWDTHQVVVTQEQAFENWVYLLVSGTGIPRVGRSYNPANHPIHLHGHDFAILQQSKEPYQIGNLNLNLDNPPRRDVAFMPGNGYLVLAFKADNPGAWALHCHIAWHASGGLALQILENPANISISAEDKAQMERTCQAWSAWTESHHFRQDDAGI